MSKFFSNLFNFSREEAPPPAVLPRPDRPAPPVYDDAPRAQPPIYPIFGPQLVPGANPGTAPAAGGERPGAGGAAQGPTISNTFHIQGVSDPDVVADLVMQRIEESAATSIGSR